jgi:hypothetical protein
VVAVSAEALEADEHPALVGLQPVGTRERRPPGELREHLPLARAPDLHLVEEGCDGRVIPGQELEPLERVVVQLLELGRRRRGRRSGRRVLHGQVERS